MADSDNSLDILINILTQQVGSEKAQDILKQVKEQSTETGKEGVKQAEEVGKATEHTNSHHKESKAILKGLATQYPELAHAAHLALNPITLSIAAIVGSVAVWKHRNDELTKSLGGIEMTAFGEDQVSRIERISAAMAKMAETKAGQTGFAKIKSDAEALIALVKDNEALFKAMGIDASGTSLRAQAEVKGLEAAQLEAHGRSLLKSAGTPMSAEREAALGAELKAAAEKAAKDKKEAEERLAFVEDFKVGSNPVTAFKYHMRYGYSMPPDQAAALEQGNIESQQGIIDRYSAFGSAAAGRAGRRKMKETGESELSAAGAADSEVVSLLRQIAANKAGAALADSPFPEGAESPQQANAQRKFFLKQKEVMQAIAEATAASQAVLERLKNIERR